MKEKEFWKSKKWWAMVAGVSVPILNRLFNLDMNPNELQIIVGSLVAYVMGQGLADLGKNSKVDEN